MTDQHANSKARVRFQSEPGKRKKRQYANEGNPQRPVNEAAKLDSSPDSSLATAAIKPTHEKVMEIMRAHKNYVALNTTESLSDLPKFVDTTAYGITEDQEDKLWSLEARRLLKAIEVLDEPLKIHNQNFPGGLSTENFQLLSRISDQILFNLHICAHDDQLLLFEFFQELFHPDKYFKSRALLANRTSIINDQSRTSERQENDGSLNQEKFKVEAQFWLIDFITATVARFAIQGLQHGNWSSRLVAGLARHAAKLKCLILSLDPATQSLNEGESLHKKMGPLRDDFENRSEISTHALRRRKSSFIEQTPAPIHNASMGIEIRTPGPNIEAMKRRQIRLANLRKSLKHQGNENGMYFTEMAIMSQFVFNALESILGAIHGNNERGLSVGAFDICALVYTTGLNGVTTLLYQGREVDLSGTSSKSFISQAFVGFQMVEQSLRNISKISVTGTTQSSLIPDVASFKFKWTKDEGHGTPFQATIELESMAQVVAVMIPLLCIDPETIRSIILLHQGNSTIAPPGEISTIDISSSNAPRFTAFASLKTAAYDRESGLVGSEANVRSLSTSLLAQNQIINSIEKDAHIEGGTMAAWKKPVSPLRPKSVSENEILTSLGTTFKEWVIEEKAIRVKCTTYASIVMTVCTILVIGGIMVGCFLGNRLKAVDPFNIATFAWVLAGFLLLVAKSLRVSEWPLRDFLLGRVPCRSVGELHSVTGIDEQDILIYLLSTEATSILITKGPYNKPFFRRGDDGFAIDVKITLKALVSSGIIPVKVVTTEGPALVCMDLRSGISVGRTRLQHLDGTEGDEDILGCSDTPEMFEDDQEVPLQIGPMRWIRIAGIYNHPQKKFR